VHPVVKISVSEIITQQCSCAWLASNIHFSCKSLFHGQTHHFQENTDGHSWQNQAKLTVRFQSALLSPHKPKFCVHPR
jgi:hypothetical protein